MTFILDTHILLWALADPSRLTERQQRELHDPTNKVLVSSINLAEIAIKSSIGKLEIAESLEANGYQGLLSAIEESGFELIDYSAVEAVLLHDLPYHHRDPFDRMIVTQALNRDCAVATVDPHFQHYSVATLQ